jgi:hypothetical protein
MPISKYNTFELLYLIDIYHLRIKNEIIIAKFLLKVI